VERLSQGGTDYAQFIKDLLGHLRDVYVVKHTAEMPASIAATEEQLDRLRGQAGRAATPHIVTLIDLLGEALRSIRQGSDARLELELALIKTTAMATLPAFATVPATPVPPAAAPRPIADAVATTTAPVAPATPPPAPSTGAGAAATKTAPEQRRPDEAPAPLIQADVDHLKRAWPVVLEAVKKRQPGLAAVLGEGRPESLDAGELVIKFPAGYGFQANQVARQENPRVIAEALREVTGKDLRITTKLAAEPVPEPEREDEDARILSKDELIRVLKKEFDARFIDDGPR
jgi:DNA polymerase-3 subunit gamma/tau